MKYCNKCGTKLLDGAAFCGECGNAVKTASVPPAPQPKKKKNGMLIGIAVLLVLVACAAIYFISQGDDSTAKSVAEKTETAEVLDWQTEYDLGMKYLSDGNYEEAIIAFEAAIEIEPKNVDAYIGLADAYVAVGDTEAAISVLEDGYGVTNDEALLEIIAQKKQLIEGQNQEKLQQDAYLAYSTFLETEKGTNDEFALEDLNGDGICELIVRGEKVEEMMMYSSSYSVYTYENSSFVQLYEKGIMGYFERELDLYMLNNTWIESYNSYGRTSIVERYTWDGDEIHNTFSRSSQMTLTEPAADGSSTTIVYMYEIDGTDVTYQEYEAYELETLGANPEKRMIEFSTNSIFVRDSVLSLWQESSSNTEYSSVEEILQSICGGWDSASDTGLFTGISTRDDGDYDMFYGYLGGDYCNFCVLHLDEARILENNILEIRVTGTGLLEDNFKDNLIYFDISYINEGVLGLGCDLDNLEQFNFIHSDYLTAWEIMWDKYYIINVG